MHKPVCYPHMDFIIDNIMTRFFFFANHFFGYRFDNNDADQLGLF